MGYSGDFEFGIQDKQCRKIAGKLWAENHSMNLVWHFLDGISRGTKWNHGKDIQQYYPENVDGEAVKEQFSGKEVGYDDAISRVIYGQKFHMHGMKEPYYTMMLMTTYGTLNRTGNERKKHFNGETVRFKYPDIVQNHYTYQHNVDNKNNRQQSTISIEKKWATSNRPNRVLALMIGVTELNIVLAMINSYGHEPM